MRIAFYLILPLVFFPQIVPAQQARAAGQFPSPMQENVRAHRRIQQKSFDGEQFVIDSILPKAIQVYIPARVRKKGSADILFHFHGNTNVVDYAADQYDGRLVAVSINLGSGSSVYARPFSDTGLFKRLLDTVTILVALKLHHRFHGRRVILSGFSAGYGAVRKIISNPSDFDRVDRILLLDGLHADYIPSNVVLADGGVIDSVQYRDFVRFCSIAAKRRSTKKFLFTHSEIFPGTFVSTTESANYLLNALGIKAEAVLKWGPGGMQQISDARQNRFRIMGFAGNSAPDHVDHLQGLWFFLNRLKKL